MAKNRSEGHFRLSNLFSYNAPVVLTFSVISLVVLLLNERLPVDLNRMLFSVYRTSFRDPLMYVRVFHSCARTRRYGSLFAEYMSSPRYRTDC